jgi:DNA-binding NtrC family response regulator
MADNRVNDRGSAGNAVTMLKILVALKTLTHNVNGSLDGHEVEMCPPGPTVLKEVGTGCYDVVILESDMHLIPQIKAADPRVEVIMLGLEDGIGIKAVKQGASAYLTLPLDNGQLRQTLLEIDEMFDTRRETGRLEEELSHKYTFQGIVGKNPKMLDVFQLLKRVAPYFRTVTILGETGTGKEVVARALHSLSAKPADPFVVCNCGGLVETLIESELFGHKKGSFTGAIKDRAGLFQAAGEGTLFLDEIGEMPLSFQPHLLRVLQNGEFRPIGGHQTFNAKCRVVAATSKNLLKEVQAGRFREDLYYRLTPLVVDLPPLRDRADDVPLLCRHFIKICNDRTGKDIKGISRGGLSILMGHEWPGNVRELENVLEQAVILANEPFLKSEHFPPRLLRPAATPTVRLRSGSSLSLEDVIRDHVEAVLKECNGNRSRAARKLGLSRRALLRRIEKFSLPPRQDTENDQQRAVHGPEAHSSEEKVAKIRSKGFR